MNATATVSPDWSQHIGIILAGIMLAVAIGKAWELADRGDGRGDMGDMSDPRLATAGHWIGVYCTVPGGTYGCNKFTERILDSDAPGVLMLWGWDDLHVGDGVYDWTELDKAIATLAARGNKEYTIGLYTTVYGSSGVERNRVPDWMQNETRFGGLDCPGNCGAVFANGITYARKWDADVEDEWVTMHEAIHNRYINDPLFIGHELQESAQFNNPEDSFTCPEYDAAIMSHSTRVAAFAGPWRSWKEMNFTCDGNETTTNGLIDDLAANGVAWGTPDIYAKVGGGRYNSQVGVYHHVRDSVDLETVPRRMPQVQYRTQELEDDVFPIERYNQSCIDIRPHVIVWWPDWAPMTDETYQIINNQSSYPLPCP